MEIAYPKISQLDVVLDNAAKELLLQYLDIVALFSNGNRAMKPVKGFELDHRNEIVSFRVVGLEFECKGVSTRLFSPKKARENFIKSRMKTHDFCNSISGGGGGASECDQIIVHIVDIFCLTNKLWKILTRLIFL